MLYTNTTAQEIFSTLRDSNNSILFIDARYDYDAFCSALSLYMVVKRLYGKSIELAYFNPVTDEYRDNLTKIIGAFPVKTEVDPEKFDFSAYDLHVFCDSGDVHRISDTGTFKLVDNLKTLCIDHHADSNKGFGDMFYVSKVSSTCALIYKLLEEEGITPTQQEAELLLVGLLSDIQFFTIQTALPWDFYCASKLLELSTKPYSHFVATYFNADSVDETKMKALTYRNIVIDESKGLVYSHATLEQMRSLSLDLDKKFDVSPVDLFLKIKCMKIAFFLKEQKEAPGTYSVSFRSKGDIDIVPVAKAFGGGGHKNAAGGIIRDAGSVENALQAVLKAITNY